MKMIDKFGSMAGGLIREDYEGVMRTFFAVPGISVSGDNLLANPQFDSGTTGWGVGYGSHSVSANVFFGTANGGASYSFHHYVSSKAAVAGDVYYVKFKVRVTNSVSTQIRAYLRSVAGGSAVNLPTVLSPVQNQWYDMSGVVTIPTGVPAGCVKLRINQEYSSSGVANGKVIQIDGRDDYGVLVMNLTDIFGAGNEPDVDYCDAFYQDFFAYSGSNYHGQVRIKPDCPIDADTVNFRGKTTSWIIGDDITSGYDCGTINEHESSSTYSEDDFVIYVGTIYRSLQNSNTGNIPISSPAYWVDVSDINNNEWYICMGTGLRNYFRAFPGSNGAYNEDIYLPSDCVHGYYFDGNPYDSIDDEDGLDTDVRYVNAIEGEAGLFNGVSSYIDCGSPADFNRTAKTGVGCAYELWFKVLNYNSGDNIFIEYNGWRAFIEIYGTCGIAAIKHDGSEEHRITSPGIVEDTWYHLVYNIYNNYTTELFIDGVSVGTDSNTNIPDNQTLGTFIGFTGGTFDGLIDQVRLYLEPLNPAEILALYEDPTSTPPSNVVHEYLLDGDATDNVGSADGTPTDMSYVSAKVGQAGLFNGSSSHNRCKECFLRIKSRIIS